MVPSPNGDDATENGDPAATDGDGADDRGGSTVDDAPTDDGERTRDDPPGEPGDDGSDGDPDGSPGRDASGARAAADEDVTGEESDDGGEGVSDGDADGGEGTGGGPPDDGGGDGDEGDDDEGGVGRRELIAGGLLLGGAGAAGLLALSGSGGPGAGTNGTATPTGTPGVGKISYPKEAYDVWREMRTATRASPDHLPAEAERLVEEGDPQAIYEFVRDEIRTIPADRPGNYGGRWTFPWRMRWGPRGTLRGGTGTIRDKAELLVDLYERAGYEAELLKVPLNAMEVSDAKELLLNEPDRSYQPDTGKEQMQRWLETTGGKPKDPESIDAAKVSQLASELAGRLPSKAKNLTGRRSVKLSWPNSVDLPVVRVRVYGDEKYANLWNLEASVDDPKIDLQRNYNEMGEPKVRSVRVRLEASTSGNSDQRERLVSGEWDLPDLVGRQIQVQTLPGVDPLQRPSTRFADVRTFVPSLSVQDVHAGKEELQSLSRTGKPFSLSGKRYTVEYDGTVKYDGTVILEGSEDGGTNGSSDAGGSVETVEVDANSANYPEIQLDVNALDGDGNTVDGLPGNAFEITEEGDPVSPTMETNEKRPRVIFAYDTSASVDLTGFYEEDRKKFRKDLKADIEEINPEAKVEFMEAKSDCWKYMTKAANQNANLIIYLSDSHGYNTNSKTPARVEAIEQGPPAIMLSVTNKIYETQEKMAELSGGKAITAKKGPQARETLREFVSDLETQLTAYTFRYQSPNVDVPDAPLPTRTATPSETATPTETPTQTPTGTGSATTTTPDRESRTVTVEVPAGDASGEGTYTVPPENRRLEPERIEKLYLTVEVGNRTVERVIADASDSEGGRSNDDGSQSERKMRERPILRAMFEDRTLSFEGSAPSLGVRLDDYLASKLSVEDVHRTAAKGEFKDAKDVEKLRKKGASVIRPEFLSMHEPIYEPVSEGSVTYEVDPRITMTSTTPRFGTKTIGREGDLLHYRLATAGGDPVSQFRTTLEKSLRMAFVEGKLYDRSTRSLLSGASLARMNDTKNNWSSDRIRQWNWFRRQSGFGNRDYALVPEAGDPLSYYSVDPWSGTAIGVLPDGTGGGQSAEGINKLLSAYARFISMLNLMVSAAQAAGAVTGPGAFSLGAVAAFYQLLARLYAAAGVAILTMDASQLEDEVAKAVARFACQIHLAIIGAAVPGWEMDAFDGLNNIIGAMGGNTACSVEGVDIE